MPDPTNIEIPQPRINLLAEIAQIPESEGVAERMQHIIETPGFSQESNGQYVFPTLRNQHAKNEIGSVTTTDISENKPFYFSLLHTIFRRRQRSSVEAQMRIGQHEGFEKSSQLAQAIKDHQAGMPITDNLKQVGTEIAEVDFVDSIFDTNREFNMLRDLTRDRLTGLWTRPALEVMFQTLADMAETHDSPLEGFTIMVLDIDNFKNINESYGHDIGDAFLKQLKMIRVDDTGYRIGGEEFVFLLPVFKDSNHRRHTGSLANRVNALKSIKPRMDEIFTQMMDTFHEFKVQTPTGQVVENRTFCMGVDFITTEELRRLNHEGKLELKNVFKRADDMLRLAKHFPNKGTLLLATPENMEVADRLLHQGRLDAPSHRVS